MQGFCVTVKMVIFQWVRRVFFWGNEFFKMITVIPWSCWELLVDKSWAILMALRTDDLFWNSFPTKKQSLVFCFPKESCICRHRSFSLLWISSIIINWCTLHRSVDGTEFTSGSSQAWNVGMSHQEFITRNIEL